MSILGVVFVLAVASLQGSSAIEGPLNPGQPLWGDDVFIWPMGPQNSTWEGTGHKSCDLFCHGTRLFAVSARDGTSGSYLGAFYSDDGGISWELGSNVTSDSEMIDPDICVSSSGDRVYFFMAAQDDTSRGSPLVFHYGLPEFDDPQYQYLAWPAEADTISSVEVERSSSGDAIWLFAADRSGSIYLTVSEDAGSTWSEAALVASGSPRICAAAGADNDMLLAFQEDSDDSIHLLSFTAPDTWEEYQIGIGASKASPAIAMEMTGAEPRVAVAYHEPGNLVTFQVTQDFVNWEKYDFGSGFYPYIDVARNTTLASLAYVKPGGADIYIRYADDLALLAEAEEYGVADYTPFVSAPPVVRRIACNSETGLLYQRRASNGSPKDLLFDTTLFTGIEGEGAGTSAPVSVFPNPAAGAFTASFQLPQPQHAVLAIYAADGRLVSEVFSGVTSGEDIDVARGLPAGVYTVVLRTDEGISSRRMVSL